MSSLRVLVVEGSAQVRADLAGELAGRTAAGGGPEGPAGLVTAGSLAEAQPLLAAAPVDVLVLGSLAEASAQEAMDRLRGRFGLAVVLLPPGQEWSAWAGEVHVVLTAPPHAGVLAHAVAQAGDALRLRREVARLQREKEEMRNAFLSLLAQEMDVTLDTVQNSIKIIRSGDVKNLGTLACMINVALDRLGGSRRLIADLLESCDDIPGLFEIDVGQAAQCIRGQRLTAAGA